MVQIKSLDISRLRNDEDFGYQARVVNLAVAMLSQDVDKPVVDAYKTALNAFDCRHPSRTESTKDTCGKC